MGKDDQGAASSGNRYQVIPRTLTFVRHEDRLLLLKGGLHKRLWAGKYNGLGGHIERGEDVYDAAAREVREEAGVVVDGLRLRGIIHIDAGDPLHGIMIFVFDATTESRETVESGEGALEWHPVNALPDAEMVEDLPVLLPHVLSGNEAPFFAAYHYDDEDRLVIRFSTPA